MAAIFLAAVLAVPQAASATTYAYDDFTDVTGADGNVWTATDQTYTHWGPADYGGTWSEFTLACDGTPDDFRIESGKGVVRTSDVLAEHDCQYLDIGQQSVEFYGNVEITETPVGGSIWAYLGVRVSDRDNAYRLRVEFKSDGTAECLMQQEAEDVDGDGIEESPGGATSTLDTEGVKVLDSGATDYDGAGDKIHIKIQASASADTVKGKCWSTTDQTPADGLWDWEVSSETTLEGAAFDGIQVRTTTATATTNSPFFKFDDLNAYSIGHSNPKVAAVGDIACRSDSSSFGSGNGFDYIAMGTSSWTKDQTGELGACQQRWTSDLVCGTTAGSCNSTYAAIIGLGDFQYDCGEWGEYTDPAKSWSYEPDLNSDGDRTDAGEDPNSWRRATDSGRWYPAVGNHEYATDSDTSDPLVDTCDDLTDWTAASEPTDYDPGECYYQAFNGYAAGSSGARDGETDPCEPATTGTANPDGTTGARPDGESAIGGFYEFDVGTWKFIVLNSGEGCNEKAPLCSGGSGSSWGTYNGVTYNDQADYLDAVVDANTQPCVGVAFHYPRFSSDGEYSRVSTTSGSATLTSIKDHTGAHNASVWDPGDKISGSGIPAGTTISSHNTNGTPNDLSDDTVTLSQNATATATNVTVQGYGDGTYSHTNGGNIGEWWDVMYRGVDDDNNPEADHRVDLVLNGHDHFFEAFGKMDETGASASNGIAQIISGAGGKSIRGIGGLTIGQTIAKNPILGDSIWDDPDTSADEYPNKTAGIVELVLKPNGYQYRFVPATPTSPVDNGTYDYPVGNGADYTSETKCNADGS